GTLYFANAQDFQTAVRSAIEAADPTPTVVVLDGESMNGVDATAVITLREFQQQLQRSGIEIWLARIKTQVMEVMRRGGVEEAIPPEHVYPSIQAAVDAFLARQVADK
ncbi:MAG: sodium-independent anion transporter, partial [Candidatus Promineifilaceae bacterium]